ncbi:hypothetical protein HK098_001880 [Nowakowskiella sp. JEL0407]|nr:hypothetical protein HK098_001880 [Nowakowskiella sp. JEL0407]
MRSLISLTTEKNFTTKEDEKQRARSFIKRKNENSDIKSIAKLETAVWHPLSISVESDNLVINNDKADALKPNRNPPILSSSGSQVDSIMSEFEVLPENIQNSKDSLNLKSQSPFNSMKANDSYEKTKKELEFNTLKSLQGHSNRKTPLRGNKQDIQGIPLISIALSRS